MFIKLKSLINTSSQGDARVPLTRWTRRTSGGQTAGQHPVGPAPALSRPAFHPAPTLNTLPLSLLCSSFPLSARRFSLHPCHPVIQRLTPMAGGALGNRESLHWRKSKARPSSGGDINGNERPAPQAQAEERSCPRAVVLKVALGGATQQEALSGLTKAGDTRQGLRGRQGRRGGGRAAPGSPVDAFQSGFFLSIWNLRLLSLTLPDS